MSCRSASGTPGGPALVEQQHARAAGDRERDFEQALFAIRERGGRLVHHVGKAEAVEDLDRLLNDDRFRSDEAPPLAAELSCARRPRARSSPAASGRANSWLIWKCARCRAAPAVRFEIGDVLSLERDAAAVGRSTPVSRLITVVLPAPFGPIRAWRAPFSTDSETSFARRDTAELLVKPLVWSTGRHPRHLRLARQARLEARLERGGGAR